MVSTVNSKRVPSAGQMINCPVIVQIELSLAFVLFVLCTTGLSVRRAEENTHPLLDNSRH